MNINITNLEGLRTLLGIESIIEDITEELITIVEEAPQLSYVYDIECICNIFTLTAVNMEDDTDIKIFVLYKDEVREINQLGYMVDFISSGIYLIGYNNFKYDDLLLAFIVSKLYRFKSTEDAIKQIYKMSCLIIENIDNEYNPDVLALKYLRKPFVGMDIMKILALDKIFKSLKQTAINIKFPKIQDFPIEHYEGLLYEKMSMFLEYNLNDCMATKAIVLHSSDEIRLRFNLSTKYNINVINQSRARVGDILFSKLYGNVTGLHYNDFKDGRTLHRSIKLKECILPKVKFTTPFFNEFLDKLLLKEIKDTKGELKEELIYGECKFVMGTGGLHSKDTPKVFRKKDTYTIKDCDVTSFYPYIIYNERIKPNHLEDGYFEAVHEVLESRVRGKKSLKDPNLTTEQRSLIEITVEGVKIIMNSFLFGKLLFEFSYMYDRKAGVSVTLNGQLFLLMLIERFTEAGIQVISANTDGITCKVKNEQISIYNKICKEWEEELGYTLEIEEYLIYARRDVNNYMAKLANGKIKRKGDLDKNGYKEDLRKGYDMPIVAIAVEDYFLNNVPITDTIYNHTDILDFCKSQKVGKKFILEYHTIQDSNLHIEPLQKTVRYYVSNTGGVLMKRSNLKAGGDNSVSNVCAGKNITVYNNHIEIPIEKYDIDYLYYIKETAKITNIIDYSVAKGMYKKKRKMHTGSMFDDI